jgi:Transcription elongation factor, GreA/GreB, C-term.
VVKVKDLDDGETYEYSIVGANEADPMETKSPMRVLLGPA